MQNDRDRLIELIKQALVKWESLRNAYINEEIDDIDDFKNVLADYLLANGVIVAPMPMAEWLRKELTEHVHERCMEEL